MQNKTVTRYLSADLHDDYESWFANATRLRELIGELEALGLKIIESDERWQR